MQTNRLRLGKILSLKGDKFALFLPSSIVTLRAFLSLIFMLLMTAALSPVEAHATEFHFELAQNVASNSYVSTAHFMAVQNYFRAVEGRLPDLVKQALENAAGKIEVSFEKLDEFEKIEISCDPKKAMNYELGYVENTRVESKKNVKIVLNKNILSVLLLGESAAQAYSCGHKNLYTQALATLLHETAHLYEHLQFTSIERNEINKCMQEYGTSKYQNSRERQLYCNYIKTRKALLSDRNEYMKLAGWVKPEMAKMDIKSFAANPIDLRSPLAYEWKNVYEHFAVNFEYFLLDEQYACRRPILYKYFSNKFSITPFASANCKVNYTVYEDNRGVAFDLNPKYLYEVHYLHAGRGEGIASRFGHSMLRLVFCDPERLQEKHLSPGPHCRMDFHYQVVVSYLANINGVMIDNWKGVTGKYPSQLFILPFLEVVKDYTETELRQLYSLPLKLSDSQKESLVYTVLENYWQYKGKYYFLSNNCATETGDLLQAISGRAENIADENPITPVGNLKYFDRIGLIDLSQMRVPENSEMQSFSNKKALVEEEVEKLNNRDKFILAYNTIFFNSKAELYEVSFKNIQNFSMKNQLSSAQNLAHAKLKDYLDSNVEARRNLITEVIRLPKSKLREVILRSLLQLERAISARTQKWLLEQLALQLDSKNPIQQVTNAGITENKANELKAQVQKIFSSDAKTLNHAHVLDMGYGIPLESEVHESDKMSSDISKPSAEQIRGDIRQLLVEQKNPLEEVFKELDCMKENVDQLNRQIILQITK